MTGMVVVFYFRKSHVIKVRLPEHILLIGTVEVGGLIAICFRRMGHLSCIAVLWCGQLILNCLATIILMRFWSITVRADRALRKRFVPTTTIRFLIKVLFFVLIYTIAVVFLVKLFGDVGQKCYFELPYVAAIPFAANTLVVRLFMIAQTKKYGTLSGDSLVDYLGVSKELQYINLTSLVTPVYLTYAHYCVVTNMDKFFPADYLFGCALVADASGSVIIPAIKVLCGFKKQKKCTPSQPILICVKSAPNYIDEASIQMTVSDILRNKVLSELLRKHAQKYLCAENVDFCLEIIEYKDRFVCKCNVDLESNQHSAQDDNYKALAYRHYRSIIEEFVVENSPSEVNISSTEKASILQFTDVDAFSSLSDVQCAAIFDKASREIEKLIRQNLLGSFSCAFTATSTHASESPESEAH